MDEKELEEQGYSSDQIDEILEGEKAGLDVTKYARKDFLAIQMHEIRLGLQEGLDVDRYAKSCYDWFQMEEIRRGMTDGVDTTLYEDPDIPYDKMRQLRKGLRVGKNLSTYLKYPSGVMRQVRNAYIGKVDIDAYIEKGYKTDQLREIRVALEHKVDIDSYLKKSYRASSIAEIRIGLENGVDVSLYAREELNWHQMREIRLGLIDQLDVKIYYSKFYSWQQMKEVRLGLMDGLDVSGYCSLCFTAGEMKRKRMLLLDLQKEALLAEMETKRVKQEDFLFEIDPYYMEAKVSVLTKGKKFTEDGLREILAESGIKNGIKQEAIDRLVNGEFDEKPILIARGELPTKGKDGYFEYFFRTHVDRKPKMLEDGSVDYLNSEWFEKVTQGQKLAEYHPAEEGLDGFTITGKVIKGRKGTEDRVLTGNGFKLSEDRRTYYSIYNGLVKLVEHELVVSNRLELFEVSMTTGNVNFDGSIIIKGNVGGGVKITATGDISIEGTVGAALIEAGGDVLLRRGMNAGGKGYIKAKGNVSSMFFESVLVEADGDISVNKSLNSELTSKGMIRSKLVISGGIISANKGFDLYNVGNTAGLKTVVRMNRDNELRREYETLVAHQNEISFELKTLMGSYTEIKKKFPPEKYSQMPLFVKLENSVFTKQEELKNISVRTEKIEKQLKAEKGFRAIIRGISYEGTRFEVGQRIWNAQNQKNVSIVVENRQLSVKEG